MRYLFLFAHPDDESAATGGTIRLLANQGQEIIVILATNGSGGSVTKCANSEAEYFGSTSALRRQEFKKACQVLGVSKQDYLGFKDSMITNHDTWGALTNRFVEQIESYQPNAIVTFDHSGWYFHLDHIAVSIAATRAFQQARHQADLLLFALFRPTGMEEKWQYVFSKELPTTHEVDISPVLTKKIAALEAHASQDLSFIKYLRQGQMNKEYFQLAKATPTGQRLLEKNPLFRPVK